MLRRNPDRLERNFDCVDRLCDGMTRAPAETVNDATSYRPANISLYSGWLPSLSSVDRVGWLPLRASSTIALVDVITRGPAGAAALATAMQRDPALLIASVAFRVSEYPATDSVDLLQLAMDWSENGRSRWQSTDWLACPQSHTESIRLERFVELDQYFQTVPIRRWLEQSSVWLDECFEQRSGFDLTALELLPLDGGSQEALRSHELIGHLINSLERQDLTAKTLKGQSDIAKRELAHSLAYGLSHEINNPLANIATRAQSLAIVVEDVDQKQSLQRIVDQTSRAHAMIADLMFYSNPPEPRMENFDLCGRIALVIESVAEAAAERGIDVRLIETEHSDDRVVSGGVVSGDPEMIGEAVLVLVRNAIDAIGTDGCIEVRSTSTLDADANVHTTVQVCDSGPGLSAQQAAKAFDPYFSGREAGRGLGLGLCRAQRILQLHDGTIEIQPALAGCVATISW